MTERIKVREATKTKITSLIFLPEILPSGYQKYFKLGYEEANWFVDANSYIGILPCKNNVIFELQPKIPIKNITYMLLRSGYIRDSLETPFESVVPYEIANLDIKGFFEALVESFLKHLDRIHSLGLIRTPLLVSENNFSRGKVNTSEYIRQYSKTFGSRIPRQYLDYEIRNDYNFFLFFCLKYLLKSSLITISKNELISRLHYFPNYRDEPISQSLLSRIRQSLEEKEIPVSRKYYYPALSLGMFILLNAGIDFSDQEDVEFKPFMIPTAKVFEAYIRNICRQYFSQLGLTVVNGKNNSKPLFDSSSEQLWMEPDIVFLSGGNPKTLIDVKYKQSPTSSDKYQMVSYLEGYGTATGAFVFLSRRENADIELHERANTKIYSIPFDPSEPIESEKYLFDTIDELLLK